MSQETAGSFFGRRKGKALRPGQARVIDELLPQLRIAPDDVPADLRSLFGRTVTGVQMEIGFGGGEHLLAAARREPEVGFIGCEPFVNGVAKLLALVEQERIDTIRLWDGDAAELLAALPAGSLDRVYLLFPDPWPKRRQRKRRFMSDENLRILARALRPDGELRFATDIDDYAGWGLARVLRSPDFVWEPAGPDAWRQPWAGWPGTRYEAKTRAAGRLASYLTFRRR